MRFELYSMDDDGRFVKPPVEVKVCETCGVLYTDEVGIFDHAHQPEESDF